MIDIGTILLRITCIFFFIRIIEDCIKEVYTEEKTVME